MRYLTSTLLLSATLLSFSTCGPTSGRDIRDYYFPFRQLTEGLVYEYTAIDSNTLEAHDYWYYRSFIQDTAMFLTVNFYNAQFLPERFSREELVSGGIVLNELFLYEADTTGRQQRTAATIESANVFPFYIDPDAPEIYLYKVRFRLPSQPASANTTLIINRQFARDTTFQLDGTDYPAIQFDLRGVVEIRDTSAGGIEPTFTGGEIYAEGIGLVEYWRSFGEQKRHYRLADRYPMTTFEEKAAQSLLPR